ncbi:O-antigen polymerase [Noviherbaspirillum aerium]|uniref:O-antigen polymerase n=1 Tax=Noviherbaspirillum aerium TaxID=2588497 RepID=UPI00124E1314|nr:O-antigen polymerase [Noviherbaspirillum aerium]
MSTPAMRSGIRIAVLGLHLAAFLLLARGYEDSVSVIYASEGFYFMPNDDKWLLALVTAAVLSIITPIRSDRASTLYYHLVLCLVLIPMLVLFHAEDLPGSYIAQVAAGYALCIAMRPMLRFTPPRWLRMSPQGLRRTFLVMTLLYIAAIVLMGGVRYLNFDLSRVYDLRADAASNLPSVFDYVSPLIGKVVVPTALVLSIMHRQYITAIVFACCSVLIFGLTAHKAPLFYPLLVLGVYAASSRKQLALLFGLGVVVALALSLADFWLARHVDDEAFGWTGKLVMRRVFFLPAQLNFMYYDFFSRNEWVWFSNSKLTLGLLDYPYDISTTHLIGREYFDSESMGANTGWFGSGYMQAGFAGVLLYAVVIAAVFRYVDECARQSGAQAMMTAAVVVPVFALLTSSDLLTAFFTHGLYLNLLILACLVNKEPLHACRTSHQRPSPLRYPRFRQAVPQPRGAGI